MVKTSSPSAPSPSELSALGVDHLDQEVILFDVKPVLDEALGGDAGTAHLREAVEVDRPETELALELGPHPLGPRLPAEEPELEAQLGGFEAGVADRLGDHERV